MNDWILKVDNLSKQFLLHEHKRLIPSTFNANFELQPGTLLALTGPSGVGKSSLLKCIWRTYLPSNGQILYRNAKGEISDLVQASEQTILSLRRQDMRFVTQFLHCLPRKSTLEVVAEPLIKSGIAKTVSLDRAATILTKLNLPEHLWAIAPATFSGGEQQRVNLARSLIEPTRLLLLDEPTASLDPVSKQLAIKLIDEIKNQGTAILAIFHDPDVVTALADHAISIQAPAQTIVHTTAEANANALNNLATSQMKAMSI